MFKVSLPYTSTGVSFAAIKFPTTSLILSLHLQVLRLKLLHSRLQIAYLLFYLLFYKEDTLLYFLILPRHYFLFNVGFYFQNGRGFCPFHYISCDYIWLCYMHVTC